MTRPPAAMIDLAAPTGQSQHDLDRALCRLSLTEFGLAERFLARYGDRFRYVEAWKKWLFFNGTRWVRTELASQRYAQYTILALKREAKHLKDNP